MEVSTEFVSPPGECGHNYATFEINGNTYCSRCFRLKRPEGIDSVLERRQDKAEHTGGAQPQPQP